MLRVLVPREVVGVGVSGIDTGREEDVLEMGQVESPVALLEGEFGVKVTI